MAVTSRASPQSCLLRRLEEAEAAKKSGEIIRDVAVDRVRPRFPREPASGLHAKYTTFPCGGAEVFFSRAALDFARADVAYQPRGADCWSVARRT